MPSLNRTIFTVLVLLFSISLIYAVRSVLLPFIIAIIIAYFSHHLVDRLAKYKLSRGTATFIILSLFTLIIIIISVLLFPIIFNQLSQLIMALPEYLIILKVNFYPKIIEILSRLNLGLEDHFANVLANERMKDKIFEMSGDLLSGIISSSFTLLNILSLVFVTPILLFYFLKDWNLISASITKHLPSKIAEDSKELSKEVHKTLLGYVKGQLIVCAILALFYSITFTLVGLDFGFVIGLFTGLLTFIPYLGATFGIVLALIVALFQGGFDIFYLTIIIAIFASGQFLEGNFLVPKLIGKRIGLHPLWVIFGLFTCGLIFGFIGILLAVPLTAVFGTIVKFIFKNYCA